MIVQQYKSCKITVFVWGKDIIVNSQISPLYFSWFYILLALHYLNAWKRLTINYFTYSVLQQKRIRQQHFTWGTKKDPLWLQRETKHMFDPALTKMGCCIKIGINFSQNGSKLAHPAITHLKLHSLFWVLRDDSSTTCLGWINLPKDNLCTWLIITIAPK